MKIWGFCEKRLFVLLGTLLLFGAFWGFGRVTNCQVVEKSDAQQIQEQIDAVAKEGGVVNLDAKTYLLDKAVIIRSNITLQGAGMDKTVLRLKDNVNDAVIKIDFYFVGTKETISAPVNHDMVIKDLTIDGNAKNNLKSWFGGIALPYSYNYRVENVHIINCRGLGGIYTSAVQGREIYEQKNYILNNVIENCVKGKYSQPGELRYGHGIYITTRFNKNVLVKGNIVRNNEGAGIFLEDSVQYIFVEENEVYGNKAFGIWVYDARDSSFKFNKVYKNGMTGIQMEGAWSAYNVFYGNEVWENQRDGIFLGTWGTNDWHPSYCVLVGNIVRNNCLSNHTSGALSGIHVQFENNTISSNHCYDDQETKTQRYGIRIEADNNIVVNNFVEGNAWEGVALDTSRIKGVIFVPHEKKDSWDPFRLVGKY